MIPESIPIVIDKPEFDTVEIFGVHDLHYGNECFDSHRWNEFTKLILSEPNRFVVFVGDLMENAVPNSKSDVFSQTATPREQHEFVESIFKQFANRTLAIVDGNHEFNRSTRLCGLFPLYSAACIAGIEDKYRSAFSVVDFGFGNVENRLCRSVGFVAHQMKDLKNFGAIDATEGFDWAWHGHDHEPNEHPRGHLIYNRQRREVRLKNCENLDNGSFLTFGGYGARGGFRPKAEKLYKLVLHARPQRQIAVETVGFYV